MQDVEANDYAARHGCPVQSLRSFPGCPAAWLFPANPACPCPCPDSPSCPCAARVCLLLPGCLRCCSSEALDCLEGHCEGGRHQTRHSCPSREGERGRREGRQRRELAALPWHRATGRLTKCKRFGPYSHRIWVTSAIARKGNMHTT